MISIVLVEDVVRDRERITALINSARGLFLQGQGYNGYDAISLAGIHKPDILLLNINLNLCDGVEVSHLLKNNSPGTSVVLMASVIESSRIEESLKGNAAAYLIKDDDLENLEVIIRKVKSGETYINPRIGNWALRSLEKFLPGKYTCGNKEVSIKFSKREVRILIFAGKGHTDKEIAEYLSLKAGTVRNYISRFMKKAGVRNRAGLVRYAINHGFSGPDAA